MKLLDKKLAAEKRASIFLYGILALALTIAITLSVLAPPELDENFCPKDSTKLDSHHVSMLIDLSDELTNLNKKIVKSILFDWLESGSSQQKISIYSLNSADMNSFEDIDTICSPPSKLLLSLGLGRQKAEQRIKLFKSRMEATIDASSKTPIKLQESKILESFRQITNSPNWYPGHSRFVIVSDLIEKSQYGDFYSKKAPNFDEWVRSPNNRSLIEEINISRGDKVQICQLRTDKPNFDARTAAKDFWVSLLEFKGIKEVSLNCNGITKG